MSHKEMVDLDLARQQFLLALTWSVSPSTFRVVPVAAGALGQIANIFFQDSAEGEPPPFTVCVRMELDEGEEKAFVYLDFASSVIIVRTTSPDVLGLVMSDLEKIYRIRG